LVDLPALERDLDALRADVDRELGPADLTHLRRMEAVGWLATLLGLATCWIWVNPLTIFALSLGTFMRWAMIGHHTIHGGYDTVPGVPERFRSKVFARGRRRVVDWLDWMAPEAWKHEHNVAHHYRLGELADPDQPEENLEWLRRSSLPMWARRLVVIALSLVWKPAYYAPNTMNSLWNHKERHSGAPLSLTEMFTAKNGRARLKAVILRCWLPYPLWRFGLLPLPFLAISTTAWGVALVNLVLAELLTNAHAFWVIVPNHAGDDLLRFDTPATTRAERLYRQIVGSTNYTCGTDQIDVFHGWLGYQIEHHVWPDLTMRQYRLVQPRLAALCARHGVPYVQESMWARAKKAMDVLTGATTMPRGGVPLAVSQPSAG
jgi:fatty acid desaturase